MSETLPFAGYCKIVGQALLSVGDTVSDPDKLPDAAVPTGTVRLTPKITGGFIRFPLAGQGVFPDPITLTLANGRPTLNGDVDVYVPPTNDPGGSPVNWVYEVTWEIAGPDGKALLIPSYDIQCPADGEVNIVTAAPVARGGGILAIQVPPVDTASRPAAVTVGAGAHIFDTTIGKPIWSTGVEWVDSEGNVA